MNKPSRLMLIRSRFYAVASFALTHVLNASRAEVHEEIRLATHSHAVNGTDSILDDDLPELPTQIEEPHGFHVKHEDSLLTPKERGELRRSVLRVKARQICA